MKLESVINEASRRKAGAIGFLIGGIGGAVVGASLAKGKQRTLADKITKLQKKVEKAGNDKQKQLAKAKTPDDKSKVEAKFEKIIAKYQRDIEATTEHLETLVKSGKGDSGLLRSTYAEKKAQAARKAA